MSFTNITNLSLGNLLQIVFTNSVRTQISKDFRDFEMIKRLKAGNSLARELRFMLLSDFGTAAIQWRSPGVSGRSFPDSRQSSVAEYSAVFKEINTTLEVEYNLWYRANKTPEKYAQPLALEIEAKSSASKRRLAADLYGDGTGVMGTIASMSITGGKAAVTLSTSDTTRGHVGFCEYGDHLVHYAANGGAGTAVTVTTGTFSYWRVKLKDRTNALVTLVPVNTLGAETTVTAWVPSAGEVFYRIGQPTVPDLTSISDYGTVTESMAGLESLQANDGRVIHGITMSGALGGTHYDCGGNPIDTKHIQRGVSQVKTAVGQDRYNWKMMTMAPETLDSLIESRETDRRFTTVEDGARGTKKFVYQHQNDSMECYTSEYVPPQRIYVIPEAKSSEKVLEFHGSDFETVKAQGDSDWHLKPGATGSYVNNMVSFLQAIGVLICTHPASILRLHNFTNS